MKQNLPAVIPQPDERIALAAATMDGAAYADAWRGLPAPVRYTYSPEVFGYLVGSVLTRYTDAQRNAFRMGFLAAMREDAQA